MGESAGLYLVRLVGFLLGVKDEDIMEWGR